MKHSVPAILMVLLASGCGKVGDPRPPKIRIPAPIMDLRATQTEANVVLTWTNPQKYIDGSIATDLKMVQIKQDGKTIATPAVSGPGKMQTYSLDVSGAFGTTPSYTIEVQTERGKPSAASNEARVQVVEVPGVVTNLRGKMDQHRIRLEWDPPIQNPAFAETYLVRRGDGAFPPVSMAVTRFDDMNVDAGKTYSYVVTAGRGTSPAVYGKPGLPFQITAVDRTPPGSPTGLEPPAISDSGANIRWNPNEEDDLAGYKIYRRDSPEAVWTLLNDMLVTITSFPDGNYRPGSYYAVSAVDDSGNESEKAPPVRAE